MKAVVQRVKSSKVKVNNEIISEIGIGFNVLFCAEDNDTFDRRRLFSKKNIKFKDI